ncbi:MAG: hypothetical protein K9J13_04150 [Saprospiraceae bacterium]|nr:hypothetical protein [Saprospiraceae bacterium]
MKLTIKYFWIFVFLLNPLLSNSQSSGSSKANEFFDKGNYKMAALEYERIVYNSDSSAERTVALLKKSYCLKMDNDFDGALSTLNRINTRGLNDSVRYLIYYEKALLSYLNGDYNSTSSEINKLEFFVEDSALTNQVLFLKILVLNEQGKWEESKDAFKRYSSAYNLNIDSDSLYNDIDDLKSEKKARILSAIIPGSGQIYGGKPFNGITNIVLEGLSIAFTTYCFINGIYASGIITGTNYIFRFYIGGIKNSGNIVKKRNEFKTKKATKSIRDLILAQEKLL